MPTGGAQITLLNEFHLAFKVISSTLKEDFWFQEIESNSTYASKYQEDGISREGPCCDYILMTTSTIKYLTHSIKQDNWFPIAFFPRTPRTQSHFSLIFSCNQYFPLNPYHHSCPGYTKPQNCPHLPDAELSGY